MGSDFYEIQVRTSSRGFEVVPEFFTKARTKDLMVKDSEFYAYYNPNTGLWSRNQDDVIDAVDNEMRRFCKEKGYPVEACKLMVYSSSGSIKKLFEAMKAIKKNNKQLDRKVIFANQETKREDYASFKLPYTLSDADCPCYKELMTTLFAPEELDKLEWSIGSVIAGDSKKIQKFIVIYGDKGTGKSTALEIIQMLFSVVKDPKDDYEKTLRYWQPFRAKDLGGADPFAYEALKDNPLIAIDDEGDLSRIEDNTRLNSLASHGPVVVNAKNVKRYSQRFESMAFIASNSRVKITEAKSGIIRRLIDIEPTGKLVPRKRYKELMKGIEFELGAIAKRCLDKYESMGKDYYADYISQRMISETNDFYSFMEDSYDYFKANDPITGNKAWDHYKFWKDAANIQYAMNKRVFKAELKNYFKKYEESGEINNRTVHDIYTGFLRSKFNFEKIPEEEQIDNAEENGWLTFGFHDNCIFDEVGKDWPAQYANKDGNPTRSWANCKTVLSNLDTTKLHWVKPPDIYVSIDFDKKDENGNKSLEKNILAASKFPPTYAELSKSGQGIHLEYIYTGDPSELDSLYEPDVEIKIYTGGYSLRRKLTRHNNYYISTISSGLPLKKKGEEKVYDWEGVQNEKHLRNMILKDFTKKSKDGKDVPTILCVQHIYDILEDAYNKGIPYDVTDLSHDITLFAAKSHNSSDRALKLVNKMHFASKDKIVERMEQLKEDTFNDERFVILDCEVFPNAFFVNYKFYGADTMVRMINPAPEEVENIFSLKWGGHNVRGYDAHILYARSQGYTIEGLFELSQKIISSAKGEKNNGKFGMAFGLPTFDTYDFASAGNKKGLKKWEIFFKKLDPDDPKNKPFLDKWGEKLKTLSHMELDIPWDQPVPEERWTEVSKYCDNDVIFTEMLFDWLKGDWEARLMLVEIANIFAPNIVSKSIDPTNNLTQRIVFEGEKEPQSEFFYRDMAQPVEDLPVDVYNFLSKRKPKMMEWWGKHTDSMLPYFPGYTFNQYDSKKESVYKGITSGEGGLVWAVPGMYYNVTTLDVRSEHPNSTITECLFGPHYTENFAQLVDLRAMIKHKDFDNAKKLFGGKLAYLLQDTSQAKGLADALKTAINAVYGQTAAGYKNPFRDPRNVDNIVAKRGALFMIDLIEAVKEIGATPIHAKTDSIKLVNMTPEQYDFVVEFGERYGYDFEIEHHFEKICLVNNSVYVGKLADDDPEDPGQWTATGEQFAVPCVFKTLFTKKELTFDDYCETKNVAKGAIYLNMNENLPEGQDNYVFVGRVGDFVPILPGHGGGELICINEPRIGAVTGTKGYRWLESELVKNLELYKYIDGSYHQNLIDKAIATINKFGSFEKFVSDEDWMNVPEGSPDEVPFVEDVA